MTTHNDTPQPKSRPKLDITGKIALITLILTCINTVTLFTFLPAMSKIDSAMEQIDFTLKMVPRFFGK